MADSVHRAIELIGARHESWEKAAKTAATISHHGRLCCRFVPEEERASETGEEARLCARLGRVSRSEGKMLGIEKCWA